MERPSVPLTRRSLFTKRVRSREHARHGCCVRDLAKEQGGRPEATIWFDGAKLPVGEVARVNAMLSDASASDDSDLRNVARYTSTVDAPRGSGPRGIEWSDVDAKYRALAPESGLPAKRVEQTLNLIHRFDQVKHVAELTGLLR